MGEQPFLLTFSAPGPQNKGSDWALHPQALGHPISLQLHSGEQCPSCKGQGGVYSRTPRPNHALAWTWGALITIRVPLLPITENNKLVLGGRSSVQIPGQMKGQPQGHSASHFHVAKSSDSNDLQPDTTSTHMHVGIQDFE